MDGNEPTRTRAVGERCPPYPADHPDRHNRAAVELTSLGLRIASSSVLDTV